MNPNFDTSFIPQRPMFKQEGEARRHEPIPVMTVVAFAVFFSSLILTGVTYFFQQREQERVGILQSQLATEKEHFNPETIDELKAVAKRLEAANTVVSKHVALSPLFDFLQGLTLKSIYYETMELKNDSKDGYVVSLKGKSPSYGLLYAQIDAFRTESKIRTVEVLNTTLEEQTGGANFDVKLLISPEIMKYIPEAPPAVLSVPTQEEGTTTPR